MSSPTFSRGKPLSLASRRQARRREDRPDDHRYAEGFLFCRRLCRQPRLRNSEPMRALISAIQSVRAAVRRWGGTVIYTREGHRQDLSDLPALKLWRSRRAGPGIGAAGPMGRFLVRGEPGWDIVEELRPEDGEAVVDKPGYGAFQQYRSWPGPRGTRRDTSDLRGRHHRRVRPLNAA